VAPVEPFSVDVVDEEHARRLKVVEAEVWFVVEFENAAFEVVGRERFVEVLV
jgi:hypothetical protein